MRVAKTAQELGAVEVLTNVSVALFVYRLLVPLASVGMHAVQHARCLNDPVTLTGVARWSAIAVRAYRSRCAGAGIALGERVDLPVSSSSKSNCLSHANTI